MMILEGNKSNQLKISKKIREKLTVIQKLKGDKEKAGENPITNNVMQDPNRKSLLGIKKYFLLFLLYS